MLIRIVAESADAIEVLLTCNDCGNQSYLDPRPFRHCFDCMRVRVESRGLTRCPVCEVQSEPRGDGASYVHDATPEIAPFLRLQELEDTGDPDFEAECIRLIRS